jgi:hypothetical protein
MPSRSCYVLEFSVLPGAARHAEGHADPTLAPIRTWLSRMLIGGPGDEVDGLALALLLGGATCGLWVVRRGKFERFIDVRPWIALVGADGHRVRTSDEREMAALKLEVDAGRGLPLTVAVAWEALAAEIPALEPPLLKPGQSLAAEFDPGQAPASGTHLASGEFEYGSWDLETGDEFDEEDEGDADE